MTSTSDWLRTIPEDIFEAYERHLVPAFFAPWAERLVETAGVRTGERVLDIACGTGIVARRAAPRVGPTGSVTGLDMLPGMLQVARRVSADVRPAIAWIEGNALDIPLPDGAFDAVLCQQGAQFFPDKVVALGEARRVLAPGGRLALSVWRPLERNPGFAAVQAALERHAPEASTFLPAAFSLGDADELRGYLAKAGFSDVVVRIEFGATRFASLDRYIVEYLGSAPITGVVAGLPEHARAAMASEIAERLRDFCDDEGVTFPLEAHVATARA